MWVATNKEESAAIQELRSLPDRPLAIVAAALMERRLSALLTGCLQDGALRKETVFERMFRSSGPVGSFSAKIHLGFMVRLYDHRTMLNLERIKDIRNRFAHDLAASSFQQFKDACMNLDIAHHFFEYGEETPMPRRARNMVAIENLAESLVDPRERFLMAAMLYSTDFAMGPPGPRLG